MAKPTNPPHTWAVQDALKLRGKIYTRTLNGQVVIQAWPKARGKPKSIYQAAWVDWFARAARASKLASPEYRDQLIEQTKGTGLYWRDLIEMAMRGKLIVYEGQYKVSVPTAEAYRTTAEAVVNGVGKWLTPTAKSWDTNGFWNAAVNPSRFTCQTAGLYLCIATIEFNGVTGGRRDTGIAINRTTWFAEQWLHASNTGGLTGQAIGIWYFNRGDYAEVWTFANANGVTAKVKNFLIIGMTPETIM